MEISGLISRLYSRRLLTAPFATEKSLDAARKPFVGSHNRLGASQLLEEVSAPFPCSFAA